MNTKTLFATAIAAATLAGGACARHDGVTQTDAGYEITTGKGIVTVQPLTDDIFRVTAAPEGADLTYLPSQSAILAPVKTEIEVSSKGDDVELKSESTIVRVNRTTGKVTFLDSDGKTLLSETEGVDNSAGVKRITFDGTDPGIIYGAGERGHSLALNGDSLVMYNRQNYGYTEGDPRISQMGITAPYFVSDKGYGVLVDDYNEALLVLGDTITYTSDTPSPLSYYFINGDDLEEVTEEYTRLTGRQDLPPLWSLGYITSKYGYHNQKEALGAIDSLKTRGYPVDGMVLDLYWYGKEQDMGRLAWDPHQWPSYRKMLADLKSRGVNMVAISQPYVLRNGRGLDNYDYLAPRGMFGKDSLGNVKEVTIWVGEGGMLDVSNPDTRLWLRDRYKALTDSGMTGWWGDLGEPEVHPEGMYHHNGLTTRQYHNLYGNEWSKIIYDLFQEEYPDTRLMTLMRGGTAGLQRYSVFPWSTDVSRSWGGLEPQIRIMLNSGLSGLGYMSHDVGGFAVDPANPVDPELYVRWCQLGLFSPVLRTHAQQHAEPYKYPEHQSILLPLVKERYRWLPYNYTLAADNARFGLPLVRPLGYYDEDPSRYDTVSDQYLWGRDVMVAPVLEQGATSRRVVFPAGTWVDINDPSKVYASGTEAEVEAPLSVLPLFARAGALLPKADYEMRNTGDYDPSRYTIDYYPVAGEYGQTTYTLFEDNRQSAKSLLEGQYALIDIAADNTPGKILLTVAKPQMTYKEMPGRRTLTFVIHNIDRPAKVTGPAKLKQAYDKKTRTLRVTARSAELPLEITIIK